MTEFNALEQIKKFKDYLTEYKNWKGVPFQTKINQATDHITVDFLDFIKYSPEIADELLNDSEETLKALDLAATDMRDNKDSKIKVRFFNVDQIPSNNIRIRDIRVYNYNKFYCFVGVINHISEIYGLITSSKFDCPSCGNVLNVLQLKQDEKREPIKCGCGRKGKFILLTQEIINAQSMILEEEFETLSGNQQPTRIEILLKQGLTSREIEKTLTLGARVCVTGTVMQKEILENRKVTNKVRPFIEANYIKPLDDKIKEIEATITQEDIVKFKEYSSRDDFLNLCVNSFAPHIFGNNEVKTALILQAYSGVTSWSGKKFNRGNIHILLVGDPSCGKTQLAKFQETVSPKYRYASGTMVSKAGLTAGVTRDELTNVFGIEAGAIVLSSGGVCVVDEADKIGDETLITLHEAMEEQQISIVKIIKTKLQALTAIIFCANWKDSRYNQFEDKFSQIDMPASLLSRFDLCFDFIDRPDSERDYKIIGNILKSRLDNTENKLEIEMMDYTFWRKHIIHCRKFNPQMTIEAQEFIKKAYVEIRAKTDMTKGMFSLTSRQGEGIYRIAEASARMHLRDVTIEDAKLAIGLTNFSLRSLSSDSITGSVDIDIMESGVSSKKRNLLHEVRKTIDDLSVQYKQIPIDELMGKFSREETRQIEEVLASMSKHGDIFEPRRGFISKL